MTSLPARFWAKVDKTETCWLWTAGTIRGYGSFGLNGRTQYAHRLTYEDAYGPIPSGLQIDHVKARGCTNTTCVNPTHLEAVTPAENLRRGSGIGGVDNDAHKHNQTKTHCPRNHPYDDENTYRTTKGGRGCRACAREHQVRYYHARNPDAKRRGPYKRKATA